MTKKDIRNGIIVGFLVGLLALPILKNLDISLGYFLLLPIIMLILAVIGLYVAQWLSKYIKFMFELAKFVMVGALNAFIDLGILGLLLWMSGSEGILYYAIFKFISFTFHAINSYFWNKYWTFKKQGRPQGKEFGKFYLAAGVGALINVGIATSLVKFIGGSNLLISVIFPLIGILIAAVWDYLAYKFFIFKK
jgi:putative flippase GtrA